MRAWTLLADENVPSALVRALRQQGHKVASVSEDSRGADDESVLRRAVAEERIVVTLDSDFGDLAFRGKIKITTGIILIRLRTDSPSSFVEVVIGAISSRDDWTGHFAVIEADRVRMTPLPSAQDDG